MSYGRTVDPDEELDAATARLMTALRWSGVFSLDVLEGDDGIARLIDINPRPYFSLALTRAAGLNVIAIWADLLLGRTPRLPRRLRTAHFRAEEHDGRALIALAHAGAPGAALRGALPRRRTAHAVLSRRDPAPARHILRLAKNTADRVRVKS
jgi:hypothetical protein